MRMPLGVAVTSTTSATGTPNDTGEAIFPRATCTAAVRDQREHFVVVELSCPANQLLCSGWLASLAGVTEMVLVCTSGTMRRPIPRA
jgi:hypothetical protein